MFFQKDYVLRMIEMMGDLMRRVKELMSDLLRMKLLEEACRRHCGISLETAESLTGESLTRLLPPVPRLMMSEILYIKAQTFSLSQDERDGLLHKSLRLLASLWEEGPLCEMRAERLLEMKEALLPLLTPGELMDAARFLQEAEQYDHMEDALFQGAERLLPGEEREAFAAEGERMLAAAAAASPQALAFAHCTKEELWASAQELRKRFGGKEPSLEG